MKEGEKPGKFLLPHGIILLEFGPYRIFMEGNPEGIQNQRPLGIMELSDQQSRVQTVILELHRAHMEYRFHDLPKTFNDVVLLPYVPDFSSPHRRLAEIHQIVTTRCTFTKKE